MDDLIDYTPELRAQALEVVKMYKMGPMFNPPVLSKVGGPLAAITIGTLGGGTNWPGAGYDPETHTVFAPASNAGVAPLGLVAPPKGFSDIRYLPGVAGREFRINEGPGFGSAADAPEVSETQSHLNNVLKNLPPPETPLQPAVGPNVQGLPIVKPPYGLLSAINMDRGEIVWQVPHGDTPDRSQPRGAQGTDDPKTGQQGAVGLVVTRSLVTGRSAVHDDPGAPAGAMLHAYDKATGKEVGRYGCPRRSGSPMTYGGRQVHHRGGERRQLPG